ncbi:hypothetical protein B0H10DRAFT_1946007 [Mycena sp. CBHHK59/15]|nr:hypothetical protein B0H10DRAFT_1946007 [Mycena sp. CBHHK59/15]
MSFNPILFGDVGQIPSFPHIHTLRVIMNLSAMSQNFQILSRFPALEVFCMDFWGQVDDGPGPRVPTTNLFPLLREYTGSHQLLHIFLPLTTLRCLTIRYCNPMHFLAELRGIRTPNNLHVDVLVDDFEGEGLDRSQAATFFAILTESSVLPAKLQKLAITWAFEDDSEDLEEDNEDLDGPPPDLQKLKVTLLSRHAALTVLWLADGLCSMLFWRKSLDGVEIEDTSTYDDHGGSIQ